MRHIDDAERRARLARRQGLVRPFDSIADATDGLVALHATEAATVHLALAARVADVTVADVDAALYDARDPVKQLAMRRTLFAFRRDLLPAVWGSAGARVADQQERQLARDLTRAGLTDDPQRWIDAATTAVLELLDDGVPRTAAQLRAAVPALAGRITRGTPEKKWSAEVAVGPQLITLLGARGVLTRGVNAGHWRLNKPVWTTTAHWLGRVPEPTSAEEGYRALVGAWLRSFGPGTEDDLVWWLGGTKTAVRGALAALEAVRVSLDGDLDGWVLPDDEDAVEDPGEWAALLPTLDPTLMGWKHRDFYLEPADRPFLFDTNGNGGNTAWWCGRVVGAWAQDSQARVHLLLRDDPGRHARAVLQECADRLTTWLGGDRVVNVYASPQMRGVALP